MEGNWGTKTSSVHSQICAQINWTNWLVYFRRWWLGLINIGQFTPNLFIKWTKLILMNEKWERWNKNEIQIQPKCFNIIVFSHNRAAFPFMYSNFARCVRSAYCRWWSQWSGSICRLFFPQILLLGTLRPFPLLPFSASILIAFRRRWPPCLIQPYLQSEFIKYSLLNIH